MDGDSCNGATKVPICGFVNVEDPDSLSGILAE